MSGLAPGLDRPHVEFIQAQMLPWRRIGAAAARPDAEYKFLSRDPATGACSALLRYPPGWAREGAEHLDADEEFYVLDGAMEIDAETYGFDSYAFLPAGYPRRRASAPRGAVTLSFFSAEPTVRAGAGGYDARRLVRRIDALHRPWDRTLNDPRLAHLGISRKDLRLDPDTGERTFLSMMLPHSEPHGSRGPQERHPVVEEAYVIAGSLTGPQGTMEPGAYFWRPPRIAHGPFGTRWGCVALIRFLGGRHVNAWSESDAPFAFDAPYAPVLPPEHAHLKAAPFAPPPRY
jgi:hypothetical protein